MIDADWPLAYAKAAGSNCPACVLTFRSRLPDVDDQGFRIDPFFKPMSLPDAAARPDVKGDLFAIADQQSQSCGRTGL